MEDGYGQGFRLTVLATGGTIEKYYDAHAGALVLGRSVIDALLAELVLPDIDITIDRVMNMDSLDMGDDDRACIVAAATEVLRVRAPDGIVVTHGTDTLARTADALAASLTALSCPVILTGAMRPFRVAESDAVQNVACAIMAARLLVPGVYAAFHGRVIPAGRIEKDYKRLTFVDSNPG